MRKYLLASTGVAALAFTAPAFAQIDEITVTAQKREQSLQDVPIAITAVTADDVESLNARDIRDLQYATPNLVIAGSDPARQSFGIRGISDRSRNAGIENRLGLYVDGVYVGRGIGVNQSTLDIQTIEVLRGPQGTLFGKNTVAGAINITTKEPGEEFGLSLTGEAGNFDHYRISGVVDVPITEKFRSKFAASYWDRGGFSEDVNTGMEFDTRQELALRGQLLFEPTDRTKAQLSFDYLENDYFALGGGERLNDPRAPGAYTVAIDGEQPFNTEVWGGGLNINHEFENGFQLTSITGYRETSILAEDVDEDYSPIPVAFTDIVTEDTEQFSQEIRLASPQGERFDWLVGLYYFNQDLSGSGAARVFAQALNPLAPAIYVSVAQNSVVDVESFAAFAHGNYNITDSLQLTAGLRFTTEKKSIDYTITDQTTLFTNGSVQDSLSNDDLSPKVSLNWFVNDDVMAYASYGKSFKSGGWNADFIRQLSALGFDDESVNAYEAGLKTTLFDSRLRLNMAGFLQKHKDYQVFAFVSLPGGGTQLTVTNAGEVTTKGVEVDAQWAVNDYITLTTAYGFTDAEFDRFANGGGPGVDFDGNTPSEAPKHNISIRADIRYPLAGGEVVFQPDYYYRSEFFSNPNNLAVNLNEGLDQFNARLGYEHGSGRWSAYLWAKNISSETKQIFNSVSFLGIPRATFNEPRTFGATLKVNFGALN